VDVPKRARNELKIVPVEYMDQVLEVALAPVSPKTKPARTKRASASREKGSEEPDKEAHGSHSSELPGRTGGDQMPAHPA
jgi:hypothetical protein